MLSTYYIICHIMWIVNETGAKYTHKDGLKALLSALLPWKDEKMLCSIRPK